MIPKSFYNLRFSVSPGGARKDAHHIYGTFQEVVEALEAELEHDASLLLTHSPDLVLDVYQRGIRENSIDLHPFITIHVSGHPDITFHASGVPVPFADADGDSAGTTTAQIARLSAADDFHDRIEATVDWDGVPVPPLVGEIAGWGDFVRLGEGSPEYLDGLDELDEDELEDELIERGWVEYGDHDFES